MYVIPGYYVFHKHLHIDMLIRLRVNFLTDNVLKSSSHCWQLVAKLITPSLSLVVYVTRLQNSLV